MTHTTLEGWLLIAGCAAPTTECKRRNAGGQDRVGFRMVNPDR